MNNNENNNFIDVESSPVYEEISMSAQNDLRNKQKLSNGKNKKGFGILGKIAGILLITVAGGIVGSAITYKAMSKLAGKSITNTSLSYVPQSFTESSKEAMSAADAFNKVSPAVVIISTITTNNNAFGMKNDVQGMGSGFIINEEGYILTNYHVIEGAKEIKVTLSDTTEVTASIINYDQEKDIAMIKLKEGTKVPAIAELGDSDEIYPGAEVIAIGTPLSKNLAYTLTKGVISGSNRTIEGANGSKMNLIQTDAAINSGNSGGPLVNTKGQVIGINSMKLGSQTMGGASVEGLGFSIPINEVKSKIDTLSKQLLNLGIKIRQIDSEIAEKYDLEEGLYIGEIEQFSPAEKAGLKIGDIIVGADGKTVKTFDDLKEIKNSKNEGDSIKLELIRNKKSINLDVVLEGSK